MSEKKGGEYRQGEKDTRNSRGIGKPQTGRTLDGLEVPPAGFHKDDKMGVTYEKPALQILYGGAIDLQKKKQ